MIRLLKLYSTKQYGYDKYICHLYSFQVSEVLLVEDESLVKHSVETVFFTDNYEVV